MSVSVGGYILTFRIQHHWTRTAMKTTGSATGGQDNAGGHDILYLSLPPVEEYPGVDLGEPSGGNARLVARYLEDSRFTDGDGGYLLVSPRTHYNLVQLPVMALSVEGAVHRDLTQTLDSEVGLLYGVPMELSAGDSLEVVVEGAPQVSAPTGRLANGGLQSWPAGTELESGAASASKRSRKITLATIITPAASQKPPRKET